MQKLLEGDDLLNLTLEKAKEIIGDYLTFEKRMAGEFSIYEFDDELPWNREHIILAFLKAMRETDNQEILNSCSSKICDLTTIFIPNPEKYEEMLGIKKMSDLTLEDKQDGV